VREEESIALRKFRESLVSLFAVICAAETSPMVFSIAEYNVERVSDKKDEVKIVR